jgi:hypothetical protein
MQLSFTRLFFCLLIATAIFSTVFGQRKGSTSEFKQLAGSSDEINQMRLPNPENLGTRSKAAMIPVRGSQTFDIPVDNTENFRVMFLSPNSKDWKLAIDSNGNGFADMRSSKDLNISRVDSTYGLGDENFPAEIFEFKSIEKGSIRISVEALNKSAVANKTGGFLVVSSESPYRLYSYVDTFSTVIGGEVGLVTSLFDRNSNNDIDRPNALIGNIERASAEITLPNGTTKSVELNDTGNGNFRVGFIPTMSGKHVAQITVRGTNPDGTGFIRTSEQLFQVGGSRAIIGRKVEASLVDDVRFQLDLPVRGLTSGQKVIVHGEVWGLNADGREEAVNWIGGMATESRGRIAVSLDSRWLANSAVKGNYEIRNIRIADVDSAIVLGESERIAMPTVFATTASKNAIGQISDEMRFGKRPTTIRTTNAVGGKLMLVHGYCSGDAWSSTGSFTNFVKFLDLNKNRTHDQFANLIKTFGASLPSFGVVAHSQGGAAALHLYTYYWSGLDYATGGSRLIQSVGTPYQGTALAGNLAAIGSVFGAGCGSNSNLTYSGAATWLSGIPTWARAKVSYHTTSFEDVWWRYDYCSLATDTFLGDPEDGVTERAYGQLSGAINLGHKTGWCHTTSMRDPGQTTDSSRNSNMNTNAAR